MAVKHFKYREFIGICGRGTNAGNKPTDDITKVTCKVCLALHAGTHPMQHKS